MHTTTVKDPVLADRDAGLVAAFETLCERIGKLEEMAEHWLRRKREKEWDKTGRLIDNSWPWIGMWSSGEAAP